VRQIVALLKLLLVAGALSVVLSLLLPSTAGARSSISVDADQLAVHARVADLRTWPRWSPWPPSPSTPVRFETGNGDAGARMAWAGESGEEAVVVTSVSPEAGIRFEVVGGGRDLDGRLRYEGEEEEETRISLSVRGEYGASPLARWRALRASRALQDELERSLRSLRRRLEAEAGTAPEGAGRTGSAGGAGPPADRPAEGASFSPAG
jgi:hypothetical protein